MCMPVCCRYWLKGPKQGTSDIFIDNLPGPPDGISIAEDGQTYWVTIYSKVGRLLMQSWQLYGLHMLPLVECSCCIACQSMSWCLGTAAV